MKKTSIALLALSLCACSGELPLPSLQFVGQSTTHEKIRGEDGVTTSSSTSWNWRTAPAAAPVAAPAPAAQSVTARPVRALAQTVVIPSQAEVSLHTPAAPEGLRAVPPGTNLKLWFYDPRTPSRASLQPGIFYQKQGDSGFTYVAGAADGTVFLTLAPGSYIFDTVEPPGQDALFQRHRYLLSITANGVAGVRGLPADARGFFAVTLDQPAPRSPGAVAQGERLRALASAPAASFVPASACQLADQATPLRDLSVDVSAGFPKVKTRLPSFGRIRALIVPLDFADLPGRDAPLPFFTPTAEAVRDFYLAQSYGRVAFDFEILPSWVRLPFLSTRYPVGQPGVDESEAYRRDVFRLLDPLLDLAQFQAVYLLVPKEMPMTRMAIGPAITAPVFVRNGVVTNGAVGGADMYFNEFEHKIAGAQWKWMAHETGHAFGLYDEDLRHASATLGSWSLMANSWSNDAIELGGWDRYLQGWLSGAQVACLSRAQLAGGVRLKLAPLVRQDSRLKVAMVPLSDAKILVLESRKNAGFDKLSATQEGVLAYTVDMKLGQLAGGYRTLRRPGSVGKGFEDAALRAGDSIEVEGVVVTVEALVADGDTLTLRVR